MNQTLSKLYSTVFVLFVIVAGTTHAQEDLLTILERGYPTQWLLCGPFDSDLEQGILEAAANAQNPLGRNDFMASLGGTENVRPVRGLEVTKENGVAVWLSTRSDGSTVDLSPFFSTIRFRYCVRRFLRQLA